MCYMGCAPFDLESRRGLPPCPVRVDERKRFREAYHAIDRETAEVLRADDGELTRS